jgi:hypothetical protein
MSEFGIYPDDRRTSTTGIKVWSPTKTPVYPKPQEDFITSWQNQTAGAGQGGSADYWERENEKQINQITGNLNNDNVDLQSLIDSLNLGYGGMTAADIAAIAAASGGGSGSASATEANRLARDKFNYDKQQDAVTKARNDAALRAMQDRYDTGGYRENADALLAILAGQETTGRENIGGVYDEAIRNIGQGYTTAQNLTNQGYSALQDYLTKNSSNPFANYQAQVGSVSNPMEAMLAAYGVGAEPVRAQVAAEQLAGQQGGQAFQDLMNILSASTQRSNESRMTESEMAQLLANTNLGAARSSYEAQAATQQQRALAELLNQISQGQFSVEQGVSQTADTLANAILAAGGNPSTGDTMAPTETTTPISQGPAPTYKPALQAIVNKIPTIKNQTLVNKIEAFAEKNPEATKAQVEKAFPSLSSAKPAGKPKK